MHSFRPAATLYTGLYYLQQIAYYRCTTDPTIMYSVIERAHNKINHTNYSVLQFKVHERMLFCQTASPHELAWQITIKDFLHRATNKVFDGCSTNKRQMSNLQIQHNQEHYIVSVSAAFPHDTTKTETVTFSIKSSTDNTTIRNQKWVLSTFVVLWTEIFSHYSH